MRVEDRPGRAFLLWHAWLPGLLFGLLVLLFETTDLDLWLSDLFFDFHRGKFFWKDTWWANQLLHTGGRLAIVGIEVACASLLIISFFRKGPHKLVNAQRALLFIVLSLAIGPGVAAGLKLVVNRPYPEHIQRYGGRLPYTRLFEGAPAGARKYAGFPAAHALGGYALMALYFVYRERGPRRSLAGLATGLIVGTLFAFGQQVRGMHYASHNIWSAAICWYGALLLYLFPFDRRVSGPLFSNRGGETRTGKAPRGRDLTLMGTLFPKAPGDPDRSGAARVLHHSSSAVIGDDSPELLPRSAK